MSQAPYIITLYFVLFFLPSGLIKSYLSQFLINSGMSYGTAGLLLGSTFALRIFLSPALTLLAERSRSKHYYTLGFSLLAPICALVIATGFSLVLIVFGIFFLMISRNFFQNLLEDAAVAAGHKLKDGYGQIRFAGSVSVAVGTITLACLSPLGYSADLMFIWLLTSSTFCFGAVVIFTLNKNQKKISPTTHSLVGVSGFSAFFTLLAAALIIGAQGAYYAIGTPWLEMRGLSHSQIFSAWCVGFVAEAIVFRYSKRIISAPCNIIASAVAICLILRSVLIYYSISTTAVLASFALQGITFSLPHAALIVFLRRLFPMHYSATATAIYFAASHGIGIASISTASGVMLIQNPVLAWLLPAVSGVLGCAAWIVSMKTSCRSQPY